jgi:hypothetical protein
VSRQGEKEMINRFPTPQFVRGATSKGGRALRVSASPLEPSKLGPTRPVTPHPSSFRSYYYVHSLSILLRVLASVPPPSSHTCRHREMPSAWDPHLASEWPAGLS